MSITPFFHVYHKYVFIMSNISKIKISGTSYSIKDENACNVVELTQAQYDDLPTTAKTSNSLFVITDATAGDLSNYYTKSETSGATEISTALSSKADTATTYTKTETDNAITAATSTKQDTLVSGTNIKTINGETLLGEGNIEIQGGSGGGKAVSGGTNISITTGETADTINCTLPISAGTGNNSIIGGLSSTASTEYCFSYGVRTKAQGTASVAFGDGSKATGNYSFATNTSIAQGAYSFSEGNKTQATNNGSHSEGFQTQSKGTGSHSEGLFTTASTDGSHTEGYETKVSNIYEHASGKHNNTVSASTTFGDSGNTLFSVGNGTADNARHNAFEIRQNGDIYITKDGQDVKLQDQLGGGGGSITIDQSLDTGSTNPVANSAITNAINDKVSNIYRDTTNLVGSGVTSLNVSYKGGSSEIKTYCASINNKQILTGSDHTKVNKFSLVETSAITTSVTSSSTDAQVPSAKAVYGQLGGLKLVKLTQSEYDSLTTKDNSTLYVIVN